jgi:threonine synthase
MELIELSCPACERVTTADPATWRCPHCLSPLEWMGPERFTRQEIDRSEPSLWRYGATLPRVAHRVSLGDPTTPLIPAQIDGMWLLCKLDGLMPSGSYKDRGASVLISYLASAGVTHAIEDSSGNAAAAIAAYAARAGIACTVFAPATASPAKLVQAAAFGATVVRVEGARDAVADAAIRAATDDSSGSYASHNWQPFFIEGVKTWALETWEQLGYEVPDAVVVPVGAGSLLLGAFKAFRSLVAGSEAERLPRLYAAQPAACAPVHQAFERGLNEVPPVDQGPTIAEGTSIRQPIRGKQLLAALRASGGGTVAVEESSIVDGLFEMARQGIYIEPTSAVAVAGARSLLRQGVLRPTERTVVLLSGNGLKATGAINELIESRNSSQA